MNAPLKCHQKDADLRQKFNDTQYGQKSSINNIQYDNYIL